MKNKKMFDFFDIATAVVSLTMIAALLFGDGSAAINGARALTVIRPGGSLFAEIADIAASSASVGGTLSAQRTAYTANPLEELTKTPDDISALIATAKEKAKNELEDGKIKERKYSAAEANVTLGKIFIMNRTETQQKLDFKKIYSTKSDIAVVDKSKPSVLIFHTHTTESYEMLDRGWYAQNYITRSNNSGRNMVRVGTEIARALEEAGYTVIHDSEIHDVSYSGAYAHSRKSVEKYLKEYPSIKVVLDVHRDAIEQENGLRIKPTATILGKKAAQIMLISGCQEGKVTDFPNWKYNLAFAMQLHEKCETKYSGLMRPILFSQRKYNMDCSNNNLLVEVGSASNTLEEAVYTGRLFGKALAELMSESGKS